MSMVQEKMYMDVDDVCAILGVSKTYAYSLMREYNKRIEGKRIYCSSWKNLYEIPGRKDLWHESRGLVMGVYKEGKNWKVQVYYKDWQGNRKRKTEKRIPNQG